MIPRDKICCFTGHRDIPARILPDLKRRLAETVELLIGQGVCCFAAGGARGFDALAARVVLEMRERYPPVKLILVLPFEGQEESCQLTGSETALTVTLSDGTVLTPAYYSDVWSRRVGWVMWEFAEPIDMDRVVSVTIEDRVIPLP